MSFRCSWIFLLLAAALLRVPAMLAAPAAPAPEQRSEARVVIPNTTLEGKPFELVLDTGSDSSLLTDALLRRLGGPFPSVVSK